MADGKVLDQTICNLPFEVVAIYENGSQILQNNSNSNLPAAVNVKIRIRNKEDTGTGRHGIISVPKLTAKNWPKRIRLVNSAQTIMSFNLAMEPNSDKAQKKSNRSLFQMFRPGGCLSIHKDEDYSYMPSTSNELNRKSTSGIEDYENSKITKTFALKKNDFSSSYTNTLKIPKTFLGNCKPGGCLDPPYSEDKYTYKPTVGDIRSLQQPVINTNSLHSDINIMHVKTKSTAQDQRINTLHDPYPETKILENTETLVTYPSTLSSSKFKTKDSQNEKPILRMLSEQGELSRKLTNEFPEAYFIPPRKEKPKTRPSYDKYNYEEIEPKIKEAYVNRDYILQSQTPSELLSDALTIVSASDNPSQSIAEPLEGVIKEKQMISDFNSITPLLLKSKDLLSNKTSLQNIQTISTTVSAKGMEIDDNTFPQDQNFSNHNNNPIIQNIYSNIKESKNVINKHISRLNSSGKVNAFQDTAEDINCKKNEDTNNNSDFEAKHQSMLYSLDLSNDISIKPSKSSINQTRISLDHFEKREESNLLGQHQNAFNNDMNKAEITDIKQQIREQSEENNFINPFKVSQSVKNDSLEYEYDNNMNGPLISNMIIKNDTDSETDHPKSLVTVQGREENETNNFNKSANDQLVENISEPSKLLVQDSDYENNDSTEELLEYQRNNRTTEQIIDTHPSVVPEILPKVSSSLHSSAKILTLKNSHRVLISPKKSYVSQKDFLLNEKNSKLTLLTNEKNNADTHNVNKKSSDTSENTLSSSLTAGYTPSQKTEIDTMYTLESIEKNNNEIISKHENPGDTDIITIPKMLQLNDLSPDKIEFDNHNGMKSQQSLSITSKMKASKDTMDSIETVPQSLQEFTAFDSLQYRSSLSYSKEASQKEAKNFNIFISDSKTLLPNLKSDLNINERDTTSDDKFRKLSNELTKNNMRSIQILPNAIIHRKSDISFDKFLEVLDKSESNIKASEKKTSQKFNNVQELNKKVPRLEVKKPLTRNNKNINSISSIAINFGFHSFTNEETGCSIETFDPSISLEQHPQDKTVTIKTILRKNDSEIKIKIDSETDLTMQMKSTRQLNGSRKIALHFLNSDTNDRRRDNICVYSSEILINQDKLLQETLKALYETLMPIEKNIIKLKEEAESLYREQLLLKEVLFSKEMRGNKIKPNVRTCSCLQRELGLDMKNY